MPTDPRPTEPVEFLRRAEKELLETSVEAQQADWVYCTYITPDSEALSSKASARLIDATVRLVKEAAHLPPKGLSAEQARKAKLLRLSLTTVAPGDPMLSERLTKLVASMQGAYAKGRHTPAGAKAPLDLQALSRILTESRDPAVLEDVWTGWHRVGRTVRPEFVEYVDLSNRGAREIGFADTGAMWRSMYDMDPEAFAKEVDRLWAQVRPFYDSLHGFVRHRLRSVYGPDRVPERGLIPAHLFGEHVGPVVGRDLSAPRSAGLRPWVRPHPAPRRPGHDADRDGPLRGTVLRLAGAPAAPRLLLGALDARAPTGSRGCLPRERLGHRLCRGPPDQDVHRDHRRGLPHDPPRARTQLLPARVRSPAIPLPRQRPRWLPRGGRGHR